MATKILDDRRPRVSLHEELVARATAAQDAVFADASVDEHLLLDSLKTLIGRLDAQMEAVVGVMKERGL